MALTFEFVLHFVRCDMVAVLPNQIINIIIIIIIIVWRRAEHMIVRWMCEVSLKDGKQSKDLKSLGYSDLAYVVRQVEFVWVSGA